MSKTESFPLPVIGIDEMSIQTELPKGAVRTAMNIDISRSGAYARRDGFIRQAADVGLHSLYYAAQKGWTVVAKSAQLNRINVDTFALTPLFTMGSARAVSYTEYNGNLYFSNRDTLGWVPSDSTTARVVGVPTPDAPTLSAANGGLLPGKYGVVVTLLNDRAEESGASEVQFLDLPDGGGIRLSGLPTLSGWSVLIYITSADGDQLRFVAELPAAFATYVVAEQAQGGECDTQYLVPMPAGDFVRWHTGRLYTAKNGTLYFSEPMRPHLHDPAHGYVPFSGHIAFVEAVADGIYVGDSRGVWFLAGTDPTKFEKRRVSGHRAVPQSSVIVQPSNFDSKLVTSELPVALWLSEAGYVAGLAGGTVIEVNADRIRVPSGLTGRTVFLVREGRKQVVTPVNSPSTATFGTAVDSVIS